MHQKQPILRVKLAHMKDVSNIWNVIWQTDLNALGVLYSWSYASFRASVNRNREFEPTYTENLLVYAILNL